MSEDIKFDMDKTTKKILNIDDEGENEEINEALELLHKHPDKYISEISIEKKGKLIIRTYRKE